MPTICDVEPGSNLLDLNIRQLPLAKVKWLERTAGCLHRHITELAVEGYIIDDIVEVEV